MSLTQILAARKANNATKIPADKWDIMERSTNDLKAQTLSANALKTGDKLPKFNLPNVSNELVSSQDLAKDFLVVSFYRGGWCPYCNMELRALQGIIPQLQELNTGLVAISPETPDNTLTTQEKNELKFTVLSDLNNTYAKSLGLVFQMPEDLREVYHSFNLNVDEHNGNKDYELPMPATYIVDRDLNIVHSFVPEDYTERLDPETILQVLKRRKAQV